MSIDKPIAEDIDDQNKMPERNLLSAIIERAIVDAVGVGKCTDASDIRQARHWLTEAPETNEPFTLTWICEHLDIEVAKVRQLYYASRSRIQIGEDLRWSAIIQEFRIKKKPARRNNKKRGWL